MTQLQSENVKLSQEKTEIDEKYKELEKEHEDLLVFLADQDKQVKTMRQRLRELGDDIPASDDDNDDDA